MKTHFKFMIKNFSIFRVKEVKNDKSPTHTISAKIGEDYVNIGACWAKEGKGGKYLSCKLQDVYVDHTDRTKTRKGFAIADEKLIAEAVVGTDAPVSSYSAPNNEIDEF